MAEEKIQKKEQKKIIVSNVYGPMVHVLKGYTISGLTQVDEIDEWLQAQIDAKKVKVEG